MTAELYYARNERTGMITTMHRVDFTDATAMFQNVDAHVGHSVGRAIHHRLTGQTVNPISESWTAISRNCVELTFDVGQGEQIYAVWVGGNEPARMVRLRPAVFAVEAITDVAADVEDTQTTDDTELVFTNAEPFLYGMIFIGVLYFWWMGGGL